MHVKVDFTISDLLMVSKDNTKKNPVNVVNLNKKNHTTTVHFMVFVLVLYTNGLRGTIHVHTHTLTWCVYRF